MLSPPPTCHHKKGGRLSFILQCNYLNSLIYNLLLNSVCVCLGVLQRKAEAQYIYRPARPLCLYILAQLRCSGLLRLTMQPKSSLLLLGQERQVAVVYFDPFW